MNKHRYRIKLKKFAPKSKRWIKVRKVMRLPKARASVLS